jgi:hypothetical protein
LLSLEFKTGVVKVTDEQALGCLGYLQPRDNQEGLSAESAWRLVPPIETATGA